jgi:zinc transporter ZupT
MSGDDPGLTTKVAALFAILVASLAGVACPTLVHRVSTGRWPATPHEPREAPPDTTAVPADACDDGDNRPQRRSRGSIVAATSSPRETQVASSGMNYMHVVKLLSAVGCGAIIATGTCHIAPEAIEGLSDTLEGEYPYALGIATAVIVIMFVIEKELTLQLQMREHKLSKAKGNLARSARASQAEPGTQRQGSCCALADAQPKSDAFEEDHCDNSKLIRASVTTHVLEIGVAVHSTVVGFALGMTDSPDQARNLMIALLFHQFCEGTAIGAAVMESRLPLKHTLVLWAVFAVTAPTGVGIGIAVILSQGGEQSWRLQLAKGVLESIALGILLYMALVDIMPNLFKLPAMDGADVDPVLDQQPSASTTDERSAAEQTLLYTTREYGATAQRAASDDESQPPPGWYRLLLYGCLSLGGLAMAVLAEWA